MAGARERAGWTGAGGVMGESIHIRSRNGHAGFTLIELVAAMVIIGVLAVTAATRIDLGQKDLDAVAKILRSNLQFAQELAMTHGATYGFHARSATQYEIFDGAAGVPATSPLNNEPFVITISPVTFFVMPADIAFARTGQPAIAADATILLSGGGGTRTITVQQGTGFVALTSP